VVVGRKVTVMVEKRESPSATVAKVTVCTTMVLFTTGWEVMATGGSLGDVVAEESEE